MEKADLHQKSEGFPHWSDWSGSGYGENRLYIESEKTNGKWVPKDTRTTRFLGVQISRVERWNQTTF